MWVLLLALAAPPALPEDAIRIRVDFGAGGVCDVSVDGPRGRAHVTYPRPTAEWRCAVPALAGPPHSGGAALEVRAPAGAPRPVGEFPRLRWERRGDRWVGTAHLSAPPAFVRLPPPGKRARAQAVALDAAVLVAALAAVLWALRRGGDG